MSEVAALYARVSTAHQEEEATIESQIAEIETFIEKRGYVLMDDHRFIDQAISGATLARQGLDDLRNHATEGLVSVVVCYSPDRLARKYAHQLVLVEELKRYGIRIEFVNQPAMADTPQTNLLLSIQGIFAEYERELIKERMRMGRLHKLRSGQLIHSTPPYGYRYVSTEHPKGGRWIVDECEADAVRQIFDWYIGEEKTTIHQIVNRLNESYRHVLRRAKRWQYSVVQRILRQTAYIGYTYCNRARVIPETIGTKRKTGHGRRVSAKQEIRPSKEWIKVTTPVILDEAIWHDVQERLLMSKKFAKRNNSTNFYMLRGLLVCHECGYTMAGQTQKGRRSYYCEYGSKKRHEHVHRHSNRLSAELLEPLVWDSVCQLLRDPQQIAAAWETLAENESGDESDNEVSRLENRQRYIDLQWTRLLDAYQDGLIDKDELMRRKEKLDHERQVVASRLDALKQRQVTSLTQSQAIESFAILCENVQEALDDPTPETKQEVLQLLVEKIIVEEDKITIKHIIPHDEQYRLIPSGLSRSYPYLTLTILIIF